MAFLITCVVAQRAATITGHHLHIPLKGGLESAKIPGSRRYMESIITSANLSRTLAARCNRDGEFRIAARYWDGSLRIAIGGTVLAFRVAAGEIAANATGAQPASDPGYIGLAGPMETWTKVLAPIPPPMFNDIVPAAAFGLLREGEDETFWQYYPAVRRLIDLLREEVNRNADV